MNINDEYIVEIEKLINEGAGLSKINDIPVFVEDSCPGDILKIKIVKISKNYLLGKIVEIITPSLFRKKAECSLHNVCGSCNWQHIVYNEQLKQKRNIVYETINKIAGIDFNVSETIPSPVINEYRHKVQLPVSQTKVSERLLTGYYKKKSHELINIKYCPMQPKIINEITEFIKQQKISGYDEKTRKGLLRHIIYRISSDNTQILIIFVINSNTTNQNLTELSDKLMSKYPQIVGICANFNTKNTNVILGDNTKIIKGNNYYIETLGNIRYKVSAESFFQVNPYCAEKIFNKVKLLIQQHIEKPTILDAYSGVSSFGIWLASVAKHVVSVEEVKTASSDALYNKQINNIDNIEIINGDAGKIFNELINKGAKFDVSVIDPPRKGCSEEAIKNLAALTKKFIVYVSCNPATLARDLKILNTYGYNPEFIQPADMFPNTYHVETIVLLTK